MSPVDPGYRTYGDPVDDTSRSGLPPATVVNANGNSAAFNVSDIAELDAILSAYPVGGTYEVDTIGLGAATAGTFVYSFAWNGVTYTTAAIAYNATNAQLLAALLAATGPTGQTLPQTGVAVTSGPLPATTTVTYSGPMSGPITAQTITPTGLTGGTPATARTTSGVAPAAMTLVVTLQQSEDLTNWFPVGASLPSISNTSPAVKPEEVFEVEGMSQLRWNYVTTGAPNYQIGITTKVKLTGNA